MRAGGAGGRPPGGGASPSGAAAPISRGSAATCGLARWHATSPTPAASAAAVTKAVLTPTGPPAPFQSSPALANGSGGRLVPVGGRRAARGSRQRRVRELLLIRRWRGANVLIQE